jgi:hypothetical protein
MFEWRFDEYPYTTLPRLVEGIEDPAKQSVSLGVRSRSSLAIQQRPLGAKNVPARLWDGSQAGT